MRCVYLTLQYLGSVPLLLSFLTISSFSSRPRASRSVILLCMMAKPGRNPIVDLNQLFTAHAPMSKNVAVREGTTKGGEAILKPVKVQRYRAGHVPENYREDIDEDEASEEEREAERLRKEREEREQKRLSVHKAKDKEQEYTVAAAWRRSISRSWMLRRIED